MADPRTYLDPKDYKYAVEKPDPDYSPERNRAIIQETVDDTEKFFKEMNGPLQNEEGKRIEVLTSYGLYSLGKGKGKTLKQYLGKKQYEALVGEKILRKLRIMETIDKLGKKNNYKNFIQ